MRRASDRSTANGLTVYYRTLTSRGAHALSKVCLAFTESHGFSGVLPSPSYFARAQQ